MGLKWSYCLRHGHLRVTWREVKERRGLREEREREGGRWGGGGRQRGRQRGRERGREGGNEENWRERGREGGREENGREGGREEDEGTKFEQLFDVWSTLN